MASNEIHVGDIGTLFKRQVLDQDNKIVDLSTTTTRHFIFTRPDGTTLTRNADLTTDGKDGYLQIYTSSTDLSQAGKWYLQIYIEIPGGAWHSTTESFIVMGNLDTQD